MPRLALTRKGALRVAAMWVVWSLAIVTLASLAMTLPVANSSPWTAVYDAPPLARWDAVWYRSIAAEGYHLRGAQGDGNVGWYPLYPIVLRVVSGVLGAPILWAGIGLSLLFLLPGLLLMADLFADWGGEESVLPGIATVLLFPTSFYFASVYSESLFLLTTALAIWAARRGSWLIAAPAGFLAALTRFNGALVVLPIAWYAVQAARKQGRRLLPAAAVATTLVGAAAYPAYLWARFGDPLLYVHDRIRGSSVQPRTLWGMGPWLVGQIRGRLSGPPSLENLSFAVELLTMALFVVLVVGLYRRKLFAEAIYTGATILLLLHSGTVAGLDRYVLVLFPCFFILAEYLRRRPVAAFGYVLASAGLGGVFLHRFVHWIMVS